ncbi:MAG: ion transporter, partial [Spirochaetales bacterium]|nr:ion transporter [Spirochaetales bacterium]
AFDLFFTIEFLVRLYLAILHNEVREYFVKRRGWIDLFASIPLLIFNSGPAALAVILGGTAVSGAAGILNVLKVIKAVRIARVLRLLRVLKIFKQIKNTDSVMAERHVTKITTMSVTAFVGVLLFSSIIIQLFSLPTMERENSQELINVMLKYNDGEKDVVDLYPKILIIKENGETVYTKYDNEYYNHTFGYTDYAYSEYEGNEFFFDIRGIERVQAMDSLMFFIIILVTVIVYTIFYSPHFAITVTDPIHVMRRGMDEHGYNFEVKIDPEFADDDIYKLAESYNNVFLPMKDRNKTDEEPDADALELKIDDIKNMF